MTKEQWKHLYRQIRLGRQEAAGTTEIVLLDHFIIDIVGIPRAVRIKNDRK